MYMYMYTIEANNSNVIDGMTYVFLVWIHETVKGAVRGRMTIIVIVCSSNDYIDRLYACTHIHKHFTNVIKYRQLQNVQMSKFSREWKIIERILTMLLSIL